MEFEERMDCHNLVTGEAILIRIWNNVRGSITDINGGTALVEVEGPR